MKIPANPARSDAQSEAHLMKSVPLRLVLVVPFVLQIFVAVGLTGYVSLRNGQKAVDSLASQLRSEISDRIDQHLDSFLETPQQINAVVLDAIAQGLLAPNDFAGIARFCWSQAKLFHVGFVNYGLATGEYAGAGIGEEEGKDELPILGETLAAGRSYNFTTDAQGNRLEAIADFEYDHRSEAWYVDTVQAGKPVWSDIYIWDGNLPGISIAFS